MFPDLSVRMEGAYRLKINVMNLAWASESCELGTSGQIVCSAMTNVFRAYTAKRFPGMLESNELMKHFAKQGLKLIIRKDGRSQSGGGTAAGGSGNKAEDEDEDD